MMFLYDEEDREFVEKYKWCVNHNGYAVSTTCNRHEGTRFFHRLVMKAKQGEIVDHINENKLDNRKSNLRIATKSLNTLNVKNPRVNNKTGVKGVQKQGNKYHAKIQINGKQIYLGTYLTIEEAHQAYENKRKEVTFNV